MKKTKLLALVLALPVIIGCQNTKKANWNDDELAIFKNHIDGYVLPYLDNNEFKNNTVSYSEESDSITVYGCQSSPELLNEYKDLLIDNGFINIPVSVNNAYYLEYEFTTPNDELRIQSVELYSFNDTGLDQTGNGTFIIEMYDSYLYEFPEEYISEYLEDIGSTATVPSYDASFYTIDDEYYDLGKISLYCYTEDTDAALTYKRALQNMNYVTGQHPDGFYYGYSPNRDLRIDFAYLNGYLEIDILQYGWDSEKIQYYVDIMTNNSGTVVPELPNALGYKVYDEWFAMTGYFEIDAMFYDDSAITDYITILVYAGWKISFDGTEDITYTAISPNEDLSLEFYYDSTSSAIVIFVEGYEKPIEEYEDESEFASKFNEWSLGTGYTLQLSSFDLTAEVRCTYMINEYWYDEFICDISFEEGNLDSVLSETVAFFEEAGVEFDKETSPDWKYYGYVDGSYLEVNIEFGDDYVYVDAY